ncbi:MAG TPA: acyltransferase domain-containing protein, partial [Solirubrobacteraceae bacterium]|nr:acyltransferase domain-containing protein [Solirubrobacteraceae bacterium]
MSAGPRDVVLVLSGHGCQWDGMAVELLEASPVFAKHLRICEAALGPYVDWSLLDVLRGAPSAPRLQRVDVVQPALFAVTVSLAELWRACGVRPAALVGHSQGEIAAVHLAGGLSLEDAARVVALRSRALLELSGRGGVVAVAQSVDRLAMQLTTDFGSPGDRLALAASNGPGSIALSGESQALEELLQVCRAADIRAGRVAIDYASHSPQVEQIEVELLDALSALEPRSAETQVISTVTGGPLDTLRCDAGHWYWGERQTVQFEQALCVLLRAGHRRFVEVGPHPVLSNAIQETADSTLDMQEEVRVVGSLRRGQGSPQRFLAALADVHSSGVEIDWEEALEQVGSTTRPASIAVHDVERGTDGGDSRDGDRDEATARPPLVLRLSATSESERVRIVLSAVLAEVGSVLGEPDLPTTSARLSFRELGLDSSGVVELRNRLRALTGLRLSATLVFDHPTPAALADRVLRELTVTGVDGREAGEREEAGKTEAGERGAGETVLPAVASRARAPGP